jgi:hypothetical protein
MHHEFLLLLAVNEITEARSLASRLQVNIVEAVEYVWVGKLEEDAQDCAGRRREMGNNGECKVSGILWF